MDIERLLKRAVGTTRGDNVWVLSSSERCAIALVTGRIEFAPEAYRSISAAEERLGPDLAAVKRYIIDHGVRYDLLLLSLADCRRLALADYQADLAVGIARKEACEEALIGITKTQRALVVAGQDDDSDAMVATFELRSQISSMIAAAGETIDGLQQAVSDLKSELEGTTKKWQQ